mmetsp:Transcript_9957/g.23121  ORF Transcript_9957/g.23121 Transcript_9957/m.23121 type:complete len:223 (+) Transcript_9957:303-971(+)
MALLHCTQFRRTHHPTRLPRPAGPVLLLCRRGRVVWARAGGGSLESVPFRRSANRRAARTADARAVGVRRGAMRRNRPGRPPYYGSLPTEQGRGVFRVRGLFRPQAHPWRLERCWLPDLLQHAPDALSPRRVCADSRVHGQARAPACRAHQRLWRGERAAVDRDARDSAHRHLLLGRREQPRPPPRLAHYRDAGRRLPRRPPPGLQHGSLHRHIDAVQDLLP